jgi:hypothetical protein
MKANRPLFRLKSRLVQGALGGLMAMLASCVGPPQRAPARARPAAAGDLCASGAAPRRGGAMRRSRRATGTGRARVAIRCPASARRGQPPRAALRCGRAQGAARSGRIGARLCPERDRHRDHIEPDAQRFGSDARRMAGGAAGRARLTAGRDGLFARAVHGGGSRAGTSMYQAGPRFRAWWRIAGRDDAC